MGGRPAISASLTLAEFAGWYWMKAELVVLCRMFGLTTTGAKLELEERLERHLGGLAPRVPARREKVGRCRRYLRPRR